MCIRRKINNIVTIGEKEVKNKTLAVRKGRKIKFGVKIDKFISELLDELKKR